MKHLWIAVYAASLLVGIAIAHLAPSRWGVTMPQATLIGSALYFSALHRYVMRRSTGPETARSARTGGMLVGLLTRTTVFLALAAIQALACFEWAPQADLRAGYVIAATWLFALGLIDHRGGDRHKRVGSAQATD